MKTVVSLQELVDSEIRPDRLFDEFLSLTQTSVTQLASTPLVTVACQACGHQASREAFVKFGLAYRECERCSSVFVSPRPSAEALAEYHRSSPAATFWRDRVLRETLQTRLEKLVQPRAEWVLDGLAEHRPRALDGVDVSTHGDLLMKALTALSPALRMSAPGRADGPLGSPASADFVTAFDTLDRVADVRALMAAVHTVLRPGGVLFVTAPCISGFDLQTLWDRSPGVLPPDKLNLLSIDGLAHLFGGPDWEIIELSTPGMLDVENVRQVVSASPDVAWPRVIARLVDQDERARLELQEYLQRHRLASFARLVVRRR